MKHEQYLRATLDMGEVPSDRQAEICATVRAGNIWHPRTVGEVRAALIIVMDKLEERSAGIAMLPYVGHVQREDCCE